MGTSGALAASQITAASGTPAAAATALQTTNQSLGKWYAISQGIGALTQLASGVSGYGAVQREAALQEQQARLIEEEALRDARIRAREIESFRGRQAQQYVSSGVTLEGTPLLMLESTRQKGQEEIDAMLARAKARADLQRAQAKMTRSAGRGAFFKSTLGAVGTGIESYVLGSRLGLFPSAKGKTPVAPPVPAQRIDIPEGTP